MELPDSGVGPAKSPDSGVARCKSQSSMVLSFDAPLESLRFVVLS
jgi:hypothetical protein